MIEDNGQIIQEDENEPSNFAMIPKMAMMDLDPYELALYCHYKITAAETGACWKSNATVARETGMSDSKMRQTRLSLVAKGYIQLTQETDTPDVNTPPIVTIINVWAENRQRYTLPLENMGDAAQKQPPAAQKHQSISNELDGIEEKVVPRKSAGKPKPYSKWQRQDVLDYYALHITDLDALVDAWGFNTRYKDLTVDEAVLFARAYVKLAKEDFKAEGYARLVVIARTHEGWKHDFSPLCLAGYITECREGRLCEPKPEPPRKLTMREELAKMGIKEIIR